MQCAQQRLHRFPLSELLIVFFVTQNAWGLNLHTGKLRHASRLDYDEYCAGHAVRQDSPELDTQVIPTHLINKLFPRASSLTVRVVVDNDRGVLLFGTRSRIEPERFTYWRGGSLTPHMQLRPHASLFFCVHDRITISKHFFEI